MFVSVTLRLYFPLDRSTKVLIGSPLNYLETAICCSLINNVATSSD